MAKNLKLNKDKLKFKEISVKYLGHTNTSEGLKSDLSKIDAFQQMKAPTNVKQLD